MRARGLVTIFGVLILPISAMAAAPPPPPVEHSSDWYQDFEDAPPGGQGPSCKTSIGLKRAEALVKQCRQVNASTHSPCSVENRCVDIQFHIKTSCRTIRFPPPYPGLKNIETPLSKMPEACRPYFKNP